MCTYLDQPRSNDVFLRIPEMLRTKHFGHEQFTGYVRLRFFFLPAQLIYSRIGSAASAERAQFPEKYLAFILIRASLYSPLVFFQAFRTGIDHFLRLYLCPRTGPWPIFTSARKNSWLTQGLPFMKLMISDWKWSLSRIQQHQISRLPSLSKRLVL